MTTTNSLIHASSPYLKQHAHNPVDWLEWRDAAWEQAVKQDKLVLVSVGYAACHWCHVMEHESFEDEATAELMNAHFICIKVDREERPDVDAVYMDACQLITGRGGWPLNVFCLPDGRPIHAGTYFPREHWNDLLLKLAVFYRNKKEEAEVYAARLKEGVEKLEIATMTGTGEAALYTLLPAIFEKWETQFDPVLGGYNWAPKFPMPASWSCLLHASQTMNKEILRFQVSRTLEKMYMGGIYDHCGGGFARYATDSQWKVPHFEKMLYDNAQLLGLYSEAFREYRNPTFEYVVHDIYKWCEREMTRPDGLYYASLDADSEGEEGKFYIWSKREIEDILGIHAALFIDYFRVDAEGLWEHGMNILLCETDRNTYALEHDLDPEWFHQYLNESLEQLYIARRQRIPPGLDDKCICSWNALMLSGLSKAAQTFPEGPFAERATRLATAMEQHFFGTDELYRIKDLAGRTIIGFSEDYALYAEALIELYQVTFEEKYIYQAETLMTWSLDKFYRPEKGLFGNEPRSHQKLFADKSDIADDVLPSANAAFAHVLLKLGYYLGHTEWIERSHQLLAGVSGRFSSFPTGYAHWIEWLLLQKDGLKQLVFATKPDTAQRKTWSEAYHPGVILAAAGSLPLTQGKSGNPEHIYVCLGQSCLPPVTHLNAAIQKLKEPSC